MNRDYYKRPIQGHSRSAHDYGNTRLGESERRSPGTGIAIGISTGLVFWSGVLIWWFS